MSSENVQKNQAIKNFLAFNRNALLSTISRNMEGYPFGSVVQYDLDAQGNFYIYISHIAEHFKNIANDSKASLLVSDEYGSREPLKLKRITVLLNFARMEPEAEALQLAAYAMRFPKAVRDDIRGNFCLMKGVPQKVRWIGGFGAMGWIGSEALVATPLDQVAYSGLDALQANHWGSHGDLNKLAQELLGSKYKHESCAILELNSENMRLALSTRSSLEVAHVKFASKLTMEGLTGQGSVAIVNAASGGSIEIA